MHLSTLKMPENFGLDWPCPSISFLISKPILYQSEKNVICVVFVVYTWVRSPVSSHPPYAACVGWLVSWKLWVVSLKYQYFDTVFRQWKCNRIITICVNAYRKRTVRTVLTNMWSDSTIDIVLDYRKPWIQAGTPWPELDHNTGRHFDTPLRLVTSRRSFRQTRHFSES